MISSGLVFMPQHPLSNRYQVRVTPTHTQEIPKTPIDYFQKNCLTNGTTPLFLSVVIDFADRQSIATVKRLQETYAIAIFTAENSQALSYNTLTSPSSLLALSRV
jgi:hypothetical protein